MATTETTTPPERCPICQMGEETRHHDGDKLEGVTYECGLSWWHGRFDHECPHAFEAALRCGATRESSPLETARTALVEAAVAWRNAVYEVANSDSAGTEQAHFDRRNAADSLLHYAAAYCALLEPKP